MRLPCIIIGDSFGSDNTNIIVRGYRKERL